jgi:hypothetical protein
MWLILPAFFVLFVIFPSSLVYLFIPESFKPPLSWRFLARLFLLPTPFYLFLLRQAWSSLKAVAYRARLRHAEAEGGQVDWRFSADAIEHSIGSAVYRLLWRRVQVTRFEDGFVLSVMAGLKYWVPSRGFTDARVVEAFAVMARQRALYYVDKIEEAKALSAVHQDK